VALVGISYGAISVFAYTIRTVGPDYERRSNMSTLSLIRWTGGKGRQLNDLLPLIPHSRTYVEPFGGGASVLLNRTKMPIEVYNDFDGALVNLFQVVRDDDLFAEFAHKLDWVLYAKEEFVRAVREHDDNGLDRVTRAVLFYTMLNQSISGKRLASSGDWARGRVDSLADRFHLRQEKLGHIHRRLRGVQIECRDALDILQEWDSPDTVFYCDPPYVLDTRSKRKYYAVEPGDEYHVQLVDVLLSLRGMVVLSGYTHPVYDRLRAAGWNTDLYGASAVMEVTKIAEQKKGRTEIVYRNPAAAEMGVFRPLFYL
jgi:DNA adenine methylase